MLLLSIQLMLVFIIFIAFLINIVFWGHTSVQNKNLYLHFSSSHIQCLPLPIACAFYSFNLLLRLKDILF